ncbi:Ribosomal L29e protein-like protein [Aureococcus anophagefferens]|uniref:60S ribosomal protein L29 n=2 Tax=Aureococcus anophagefferens TaxID=44056 RepID=F0YNG6_AURAN|nr:hypothetical protein AURANDRAFT_34148 [Aureococcus anophagefferens]EGB03343.1 hypothetical protein AURANDRAFT_34148 [Aureococcus anophagefferens]KAH8054000.1 Ribosomal L29e protein-like protein [Aureococcus anophagefferens]|eukprot:XP_009041954.1 hypothetical protein AURANDRAFT_34148 [Aureococcus anophagefferens]
MVKQKNHTARNKTVKEHARGIKKARRPRHELSLKGIDPKALRNRKFSLRWNKGGRPSVDSESDDDDEEEEEA